MVVTLPMRQASDIDVNLSSSTIVTAIGETNYNKFYGYAEQFIYIIGSVFIIFTVFGITKGLGIQKI